MDPSDHALGVDRWLAHAGDGATAERRIALLERGLDVVWQRAHRTLGEITVVAVADRVVFHAAEKFPQLAPLAADAKGFHFDKLGASPRGEALLPALRFVLIELLTILGNLTDDILTPALHFELSNVGLGEASPTVEPRRVADEGEGGTP